MSIFMETFASENRAAARDTFEALTRRVRVFQVQCHYCGYEPGTVVAPEFCPKCHGASWERFARPRSILEATQKHKAGAACHAEN